MAVDPLLDEVVRGGDLIGGYDRESMGESLVDDEPPRLEERGNDQDVGLPIELGERTLVCVSEMTNSMIHGRRLLDDRS